MTRFDIWEGHGIVVSVSNMEADKSGYNELGIDKGFQ